MTRHLVVAPQPGYEGKTLGVMFHNSQAVVDEHSVDPKLGRTPAEVIRAFKMDFPAYTVEALGGPVAVTVPEMPWKEKPVERGAGGVEGKPKAKRTAKSRPKAKTA